VTTSRGLSIRDVLYAIDLAIACVITYYVALYVFPTFFNDANHAIGVLWAAISAAFVFREDRAHALSAGLGRLRATCVSFVLCLIYLWFLPATPLGMGVLIAAGGIIVIALGWRDDVITTAITTIVVVAVAALAPHNAWQQPVLRFFDTVLGIVVGIVCKWVASLLFQRVRGAAPVSQG
jgi:uncharacterized membrane protein YccC